MRKPFSLLLCLCFLSCTLGGCGYTTHAVLAGGVKTIHVEHFKNKISYKDAGVRRKIYIPLLEVKVTDAVIKRFLFDGNLKIVSREKADVILKGELLNYQRDALRYTDNNDVQEYRINITVSLTLINRLKDTVVWAEPSFVGETTYFTTGSQAMSENKAIKNALEDLARRVVERTIEDW